MEACLKEINLPSGAVLKIGNTPFEASLALKEAVMEELKALPFKADADVTDVIKNLYCISFSSQKIKTALWECLKRHTYNSGQGDLKITSQTFQPAEARQDYETVCMEVTQAELAPFGKQGFAKFARLAGEMINSLASG